MPTSSLQGKKEIIEWITTRKNISKVLDIGAGEGTYPKLFKEDKNMLVNADWWAIEAWTPYIEEYQLASLYDNILNEDVRSIDWNKLPNFDLVICGDVLEHMTKEESQEVVSKALEKTKELIISIPIVRAKQGAVGGNPFEIHVKDNWSHEEVLDSFPNIKEHATTKRIGVYLLSA